MTRIQAMARLVRISDVIFECLHVIEEATGEDEDVRHAIGNMADVMKAGWSLMVALGESDGHHNPETAPLLNVLLDVDGLDCLEEFFQWQEAYAEPRSEPGWARPGQN